MGGSIKIDLSFFFVFFFKYRNNNIKDAKRSSSKDPSNFKWQEKRWGVEGTWEEELRAGLLKLNMRMNHLAPC